MSGYLFYAPRYRPTKSTGGIFPNATLTIYLSETTTLAAVYDDLELTVPISNPVTADSSGMFPAFFLSSNVKYRVILKDKNGAVQYDEDPYVVQVNPFSTGLSIDGTGHIQAGLPTSNGPTLTIPSSSASDGVNVSSDSGQSATISLSQTGHSNWKIYEPGGSDDLRVAAASDIITVSKEGNVVLSPPVSGSTLVANQAGSSTPGLGGVKVQGQPGFPAEINLSAGGITADKSVRIGQFPGGAFGIFSGATTQQLFIGYEDDYRVKIAPTTLGLTGTTIFIDGKVALNAGFGIPSGGNTNRSITMSVTPNFGIFYGSGTPTLSAAKGSLYLRSDGSTTNDRMYVNTDGSTTWTAVITAA